MAYNPGPNIARDEDSYNNLAHAPYMDHSMPASCGSSGPNEGISQMNDMLHQPLDFVNNPGHNGFVPSSSFNNNNKNNPNATHMAPSYTDLQPPSQPRASAPSLPKTNTSTYGIMPPNPYPFDPTSIRPPVSPSIDLYLCKGCYTTVESRVRYIYTYPSSHFSLTSSSYSPSAHRRQNLLEPRLILAATTSISISYVTSAPLVAALALQHAPIRAQVLIPIPPP